MVIADGVRTLVLAVMGVLVLVHEIAWPVVLVVAVIDRVGDTIFSPSSTAALPTIVHERPVGGRRGPPPRRASTPPAWGSGAGGRAVQPRALRALLR